MRNKSGFEDFYLRKEGIELAHDLMVCLESCGNSKLCSQLRQYADIAANIAVGFEKLSGHDPVQFVYFVKGACAELNKQIEFAGKRRLISLEAGANLLRRNRKISKLVYGLIRETNTDQGGSKQGHRGCSQSMGRC